MIFSQYKEPCEVHIDYPKIVGDHIKDLEKSIRNILHANIDVHSRKVVSEFSGDGVKCIATLQSQCANINFLKN